MSGSRPDDFDEMVLSARTGRQLHIGDRIALCVQRGGKTYCMSSEGFVELSCSLREVALGGTAPWNFVDCQWTVHVKCQYDAAKRVRHSLKAQARDHALGNSPALAAPVSVSVPTMAKGRPVDMKSLVQMAQASREQVFGAGEQDTAAREAQQQADLLLAMSVEQAANIARNEEKRGTPINYGETIQLLHAKSGNFLKLLPKYRAQAVGCYQVVLAHGVAAPIT